jgi:hypothetical protein
MLSIIPVWVRFPGLVFIEALCMVARTRGQVPGHAPCFVLHLLHNLSFLPPPPSSRAPPLPQLLLLCVRHDDICRLMHLVDTVVQERSWVLAACLIGLLLLSSGAGAVCVAMYSPWGCVRV